MNNVNLVGRLAKDPIARDRGDTRITELTLVTERPRIRDGKVEKDPETGYPLKGMMPYGTGKALTDEQVLQVASYILSKHGTSPASPKPIDASDDLPCR